MLTTQQISHPHQRARRRSLAGRAALLYAIGAVTWIVVTDVVVDALELESAWVNIAKGFYFIAATTLLLWLAFRRHEHEVAGMVADLEHAGNQRIAALEGVTQAVGAMIEARDPYTAGHQLRVGELARRIGRHLGLDDERVEGLRIGGYLQDVGKIAVDEEVLNFQGEHDDEQRAHVQIHSASGYEILRSVPFVWPVAEIALQHHERLDGSGYPQGLSGDEILLDARIVAVADVFDAMTCERPYRAAGSVAAAVDVLTEGAGTQFDPVAVQALMAIIAERA